MGLLRSNSARAAWWIRSRRAFSRTEFWLVLLGYDVKTHSFNNKIYTVYAVLFFSLWAFMVLTLLAGVGGQFLQILPFPTLPGSAVVIGGITVIAFFLVELYRVTRRSPFVFSEPDSSLLCLTPIDRRPVAFFWFLGDWLLRALLLGAGFVVLGYALQEAQAARELTVRDLPIYLLAGSRILIISLPLFLAVQALAWSVGAWRLWGWREISNLRIGVLVFSTAVVGVIFLNLRSNLALPGWLWPLVFPVQAGVGGAPWAAGMALSMIWAFLGLLVLWRASEGISLARASQETRGVEAQQAAMAIGAVDVLEEQKQRERLGTGKRPSRLPAREGLGALLWRNLTQALRSLALGQLAPWLLLLGSSLGIFLAPDWGTRAWASAFWIAFAGQRSVPRLRKDLGRWWLLHQLPYSAEKQVLMDLMTPLFGLWLAGLAALFLAQSLSIPVPAIFAWMYFFGAASVVLGAAVDLLLQCKEEQLIAGNVPDLTFVTLLLGILAGAVPGVIAWLAFSRWSIPLWGVIPAMLGVSLGMSYSFYRISGRLLRKIH